MRDVALERLRLIKEYTVERPWICDESGIDRLQDDSSFVGEHEFEAMKLLSCGPYLDLPIECLESIPRTDDVQRTLEGLGRFIGSMNAVYPHWSTKAVEEAYDLLSKLL